MTQLQPHLVQWTLIVRRSVNGGPGWWSVARAADLPVGYETLGREVAVAP